MKKFISLSILFLCFTNFIQSCEPENITSTPKPTLASVIYSEKLHSSTGIVFCERLVCISPETAANLPLEFINTHKDGSIAHLTMLGLKFNTGTYIETSLPANASELKPKKLPSSPGEPMQLAQVSPFNLYNVHLKSAPWNTTSNKIS